jgi:F-type H+-transporting ATPase subunit b
VYTLAVVAGVAPAAQLAAAASAPATEASGLSINLFWVIVGALNFLVFLAIIWRYAFDPIAEILDQRKARIEQGLADAEAARRDRDAAAAERDRVIADARKEASALIAASQKATQDLREADIAATREELTRLRERATAEIAAERDRALLELRAQVADLALAAAGKVVGESMTAPRQRRLVEEFLAEQTPAAAGQAEGAGEGRPRGGRRGRSGGQSSPPNGRPN